MPNTAPRVLGTLVVLLLAASPLAAQTEIVVVDDTVFDWFNAPMNPGCPGCGLRDWDDLYNSGYACRRLPDGARGALCAGEIDPDDPDWDDTTAIRGSLEIRSALANRFDGLVTEFDDGDEAFPPYDPAVSGAIQSLTGTYSLRHAGHNGPGTNAIEGHLLVKQGADFFVSEHAVPASSGGGLGDWVRVGEAGGVPIAFTADDFEKVIDGAPPDPNQVPDFSASGAPLFFGFAVDLSYQGALGGPPNNPFLNRSFDVDDIEIRVTPTNAAPVPSLGPWGLALLGALLAGAGTLARARPQSSRAWSDQSNTRTSLCSRRKERQASGSLSKIRQR